MSAGAQSIAKPLAGKRIIVSRAKEQAGVLSAQLRELGAEVSEIPFIEIQQPASFEPLDTALRSLASYRWLILTSVNGVQAMFARMTELGIGENVLVQLHIAAIGPATRKAIEARGLHVEVMPREYVAESVVAALQDRVRNQRVLLLRAKVARDVIPKELSRTAAAVDVIEAYETVLPTESRTAILAALQSPDRRPDVITFTSSSTARNFVALLGEAENLPQLLAGINLASIGPVTTATLQEIGVPPQIVATEYTIPGLVRAIIAHFQT